VEVDSGRATSSPPLPRTGRAPTPGVATFAVTLPGVRHARYEVVTLPGVGARPVRTPDTEEESAALAARPLSTHR